MLSDNLVSTKRIFKLLLVDDDAVTNRVLSVFLKKEKFKVFSAFSGVEAFNFLDKENIDIVLLDVMMPNMDGLTVLSHLREKYSTPVLILTSLSGHDVIEQAFLNGADDYIVKPFSPPQLLERIEVLLKLIPPGDDSTVYSSGDVKLLPNKQQFQVGEKVGNLSVIETRLLQHFVKNPDTMVPIEDLLRVGWSREEKYTVQEKEMLKLAINHLREKMEPDIDNPVYLPRVNGDGYIFHPVK